MCGICGVMTRDGSRPDPVVLEEMSRAIAHRGPGSDGMSIDGPAGLAGRRGPVGVAVGRLATTARQHGNQRIAAEDGRVRVVQNGEIYNYRALRAVLER